jgi:MFS family permease
MIMMAIGRFTGDKLAMQFSRKRMVQVSGILIFTGMLMAVVLPFLVTAVIGFAIVGLGVSTIIPLLYSTRWQSIVNSFQRHCYCHSKQHQRFSGFLLGPPLIGYIAQVAGLQYSFITIAFLGLGISLMVSKVTEIT